MMSRLRLPGLLSLLVATTACAPAFQLAVRPTQPTGEFVEGREQALAVADSVEVRLSFVRYEPTQLVFEAEYRNPTKRALVVAPTDFRVLPRRQSTPAKPAGHGWPMPAPGVEVSAAVAAELSAASSPYLPTLPTSVAATDPEVEIEALHTEADRENSRANRVDWLGLAFSLTSVVTDVASIGKNETVAQRQRRESLAAAAITYNVASATAKTQHALEADRLRAQEGRLRASALRKTTLHPGQQVYGLLWFPRFDTADDFTLQAPGPVGPVLLEFRQTRKRE